MLFDHELSGGGRPLRKFLNGFKDTDKKKDEIEKNSFLHLCDNLFVVATPKVVGLKDSSIEDLFDANILAVEIAGKKFDRSRKNGNGAFHYGKEIFSRYIFRHYQDVSFQGFIPLLKSFQTVIDYYTDFSKSY